MIIGGGFGNVISRALNNGAVVDFVYIDFGLVSTGIFNIADIAIITGVMMLFAYQFNKNRPDN